MQFIISITLFISTVIKKKSRIIVILLSLFLWILYAFNTNNADYESYKLNYIGYYKPELGFHLLCKIGNLLNMSYQFFLGTISLLCLLIVNSCIKRYTNNTAFVLGLYFVFPFLLDVVQVRNFIEMTIFIYSIRYLIEDKKLNNLKYFLAILLATSIHTSAAFYGILLIVKYINIKKLFNVILIVVPSGCVLAYSGILNNVFVLFKLPIFKNWFQSRSRLGFILMFAIQIFSFIILYIAYDMLNRNDNKIYVYKTSKIDVNKRRIILTKNNFNIITFNSYTIIIKINILLFLIFIFYMYNAIYFRLFRNILILNYCVIAQAISYSFKNMKNRNLYIICVLLWIIFLFGYMIFYTRMHTVFIPIFNDNIIFEYIRNLI